MRSFNSADVGRAIRTSLVLLLVAVMLAPAVVVAFMSFTSGPHLALPPDGFGVERYRDLVDRPRWLDATKTSLAVAVPAALLSTLVSLGAALAIRRGTLRFGNAISALAVIPMVLPGVAYAVALYATFVKFSWLGDYWPVVLATSTLVLPLSYVTVLSGLLRQSSDLEQTAMSLGARKVATYFTVTLPMLLPAVVAAALMAFLLAFDEAVVINFLGAQNLHTLPREIFESLRTGIDPTVTALATSLMLLTGLIMASYAFVMRLGTRRLSQASEPPSNNQVLTAHAPMEDNR